MPAAVADGGKPEPESDRSEQMWRVLKAHITRERARKKQEREAEVEEERLRKEREAREQQEAMTLGETREQITQLESKLTKLKEEKHQLFLQLKKVLNEDDNRRRQLVKESNEMIAIQALPASLMQQQQLYITPSNMPRSNQMPPQQQQQQQQGGFKPAIKRPRSPSPPPVVPVSSYHQGYGYKPSPVSAAGYQGSPQKPQYPPGQPGGGFYSVPPQDLSLYYPMTALPSRGGEPARGVYGEPPRPPPQAAYHIEQPKMPDHYSLRGPPTSVQQQQQHHVIHGGSMALSPAQPPSKTGSITAGYPAARSQQQYQQQAAPASLYTAQSRSLYQSPGTPMNYPQRE